MLCCHRRVQQGHAFVVVYVPSEAEGEREGGPFCPGTMRSRAGSERERRHENENDEEEEEEGEKDHYPARPQKTGAGRPKDGKEV